MREAHYTPQELLIDIHDGARHVSCLESLNKVPVVAYTRNSQGQLLYLYKKTHYAGPTPLIASGNPIYILIDITYQELIDDCQWYLFAHVDEVTIHEGNKSYKNKLSNI